MKYNKGDKVELKRDVIEGCHDSDTDVDVLKECNFITTIEEARNNIYFMEEVGWWYTKDDIIGLAQKPKTVTRFQLLDI